MPLIRSLNTIEQAFSIGNAFSPLVVVCVLRLKQSPPAEKLKQTLEELQSRHLLLRATLEEKKKSWEFHLMNPVHPIHLEVLKRKIPSDWKAATEQGLNTSFPPNVPLMRCVYLKNTSNEAASELLVIFHHAIIDSVGARLILDEILSLLGNVPLSPPMVSPSNIELFIPQFPDEFQGWKLKQKLLPFMGRQFKSELSYGWKGLKREVPPTAQNRILNLQFDVSQSRKMVLAAGRKGLTLNSLLSAAMLLSVHRELFYKQKGLLRSIGFASIREGMNREVIDSELGCCISMLRFDVPVLPENDFWEIARYLQRQMLRAGKKGEMYLNAHLSKSLMQMMFRQNSMRLATTALSFIGALDLQARYGNVDLFEVHTFISNNRLGPIFTGFAKILFGKIGLNCNYLEGDVSVEVAERILEGVHSLIVENCLS